mmetsp:Transcript_25914/g.54489  ORF Transcript_25914/g.54489 Transcript_25914/m.54489 type:complete len:149 (+) Transcript_25914:890-1336(+)
MPPNVRDVSLDLLTPMDPPRPSAESTLTEPKRLGTVTCGKKVPSLPSNPTTLPWKSPKMEHLLSWSSTLLGANSAKKMEDDLSAFAADSDIAVYKFRGDEEREFASANLNTESFPTVNVINADGTVVKYESEDRSPEAIKKFVADTIA